MTHSNDNKKNTIIYIVLLTLVQAYTVHTVLGRRSRNTMKLFRISNGLKRSILAAERSRGEARRSTPYVRLLAVCRPTSQLQKLSSIPAECEPAAAALYIQCSLWVPGWSLQLNTPACCWVLMLNDFYGFLHEM